MQTKQTDRVDGRWSIFGAGTQALYSIVWQVGI